MSVHEGRYALQLAEQQWVLSLKCTPSHCHNPNSSLDWLSLLSWAAPNNQEWKWRKRARAPGKGCPGMEWWLGGGVPPEWYRAHGWRDGCYWRGSQREWKWRDAEVKECGWWKLGGGIKPKHFRTFFPKVDSKYGEGGDYPMAKCLGNMGQNKIS